MFWDFVAGVYDFFEDFYNGKVNRELADRVALMVRPTDVVLECACGTGMISKRMAPRCKRLVATDFSEGMLKRARHKCADFNNIVFCNADITKLGYADASFNKVVAGNVIHLLAEPEVAMGELERVCRPGGKIIVPTYVNYENNGKPSLFIRLLEKFGANFKRQFSYRTYRQFFANMGYSNVEFSLVEGKMPCAIAVITKA